jgi:hypothetical protein
MTTPEREEALQRVNEAVAMAAAADQREEQEGWGDDGLSDLTSIAPREAGGEEQGVTTLGGRVDPPTRSEEGTVGLNWSEAEEDRVEDASTTTRHTTETEDEESTGASSELPDSDEDTVEGDEDADEFVGPRKVASPRVLPPIIVPELHKFLKYYDVGMNLMAAANPKGHVLMRLSEFLSSVFEADDTACFYVVNNRDRETDSLAITANNYRSVLDERPSLPFWRKYFFWLMPRLRSGWRKVFFLMGHHETLEDIRADSEAEWHEKFWCYEKVLQYDNTVEVGWAFRSHRNVNFEALAREVTRWCGFPVGVCWKGVMPYDRHRKHHAVHFEVMGENAMADWLALCRLYRAQKKGGWPQEMNFRFVPTLDNTNPEAQATVHDMRIRQRIFNDGVSHWYTTDFADVDRYEKRLGGTLREYLAAIPSSTRPGLKLLLGVNQARNTTELAYWVTALPQLHMEAFTVMHGLLPFMRYQEQPRKKKAFNKMFHPKVVKRAKGTEWDPEIGVVVSYETSHLSDMRRVDEDLEEFVKPVLEREHLEARQAEEERLAGAKRSAEGEAGEDDDESIGQDSSVGSIAMIPLVNGRKARRVREDPNEPERRVQFNPKVRRVVIPGRLFRVQPAVEATSVTQRVTGPQTVAGSEPDNLRAHYAAGAVPQLARPPPEPDGEGRR